MNPRVYLSNRFQIITIIRYTFVFVVLQKCNTNEKPGQDPKVDLPETLKLLKIFSNELQILQSATFD